MASTYRELYSDFQDKIKLYTEKLDFTEQQFMRRLTRGMQLFQRDIEMIEAYADISRADVTGPFLLPNDLLRIKELKDANNYTILAQGFNQWNRNQEHTLDNKLETPVDYSTRMTQYQPGGARLYAVWGRNLDLFPDEQDTALQLWYIPDIHAFSRASTQWQAWFANQTAFVNLFDTAVMHASLAPYEDAFVNYAVADFIQSQGSANYKVFESYFNKAKEEARLNKPMYNKESVRDYFFSPWS